MFPQSNEDLLRLSFTFREELESLKRRGYQIGGKNITFLFKLDGVPSGYGIPPSAPFHFFLKESDIMISEDVKKENPPVDNSEYDI